MDINDRIDNNFCEPPKLGKIKIEVSSTILTIFVIVLSFVAIILLWLYAQQTTQMKLAVFFLSLIIIVSVVVFIDQIQKRYQLNQLQLRQLITQRTRELETAKAAAEAARIQAEQINQQLQASLGHANMMTQQALEASRNKSEFLMEMSHQIRIPMNAIMGFSEMLAEENLTDQQRKQVHIIRESAKQLLQLINDILDFSKIEAGKLELDVAEHSLESILAAVESSMRPGAMEKGLQFDIIRSQPLPEVIRTDATRLKQCLANLINNAIRATDKGYVYVKVLWDNSTNKPAIHFDIEYTPSILSANRHLYTPSKLGLSGLGLTVTQKLAELLEGSVVVSSTNGKSSTLTLTIPTSMSVPVAASSAPAKKALTPPAEKPVEIAKVGGRILLAEDSPTNQALVEILLKKLGVEVVTVENGKLAVQKALKEKFDLILMDIQMPVMNGYEATVQIRKNGIKTPIIALTACAMKGDDEKCIAAGCSDYLPKPIDKKKFLEMVTKYLTAASKSHTQEQPAYSPVANSSVQNSEPARVSGDEEACVAGSDIEIDWRLLMDRVGSEDLIDEIIPIFIKDNTERMKMLAEAVEKNDEREIKFYAHSIKGAAATIGASSLSELAKQLETAVRDLDNTKYRELFQQLNNRFNQLISFLSRKDWKQIAQEASNRKVS